MLQFQSPFLPLYKATSNDPLTKDELSYVEKHSTLIFPYYCRIFHEANVRASLKFGKIGEWSFNSHRKKPDTIPAEQYVFFVMC